MPLDSVVGDSAVAEDVPLELAAGVLAVVAGVESLGDGAVALRLGNALDVVGVTVAIPVDEAVSVAEAAGALGAVVDDAGVVGGKVTDPLGATPGRLGGAVEVVGVGCDVKDALGATPGGLGTGVRGGVGVRVTAGRDAVGSAMAGEPGMRVGVGSPEPPPMELQPDRTPTTTSDAATTVTRMVALRRGASPRPTLPQKSASEVAGRAIRTVGAVNPELNPRLG